VHHRKLIEGDYRDGPEVVDGLLGEEHCDERIPAASGTEQRRSDREFLEITLV
jgi:hypothetical protein